MGKVCAILNLDEKKVVLDSVKTRFGERKMLGIARVYDDEETLKKTERPYLMERGKPKPKEGAETEAPKEAAKADPEGTCQGRPEKRRNLPRRSPQRRLVRDGREEVEPLHPPGREGRPREEALPQVRARSPHGRAYGPGLVRQVRVHRVQEEVIHAERPGPGDRGHGLEPLCIRLR